MRDFREPGRGAARRKGPLFLWFFASFGVALFFLTSVFPGPMTSLVHRFALPAWEFGRGFAAAHTGIPAFFASKRSLLEENRKLREGLVGEETLRLQLAGLEEENARLRSLLGRSTTTPGILASVLAAPPRVLYDTLVVDLGADDGLVVGDIAVWEGIAVGTVARVGERSSVISLFSSPGRETPVLLGPDSLPAIAVGQGGGTFTAELSREVEIAEGALVRLSARTFPFFGVIERVESSPAGPVQTLYFKLPMNLFSIRSVVIIPRALYEA